MKFALTVALCAALMAVPVLAEDYCKDCAGGEVGTVTTTDLKGHACQITISGGIDIPSVWRSSGLNAVLNRSGVRAGEDTSESDAFWSPLVTLRFDASLAKHVTGVIELQNPRLRSNMHFQKDAIGRNDRWEADNDPFDTNPGWGSDANEDLFGGRDIPITVHQAYINVDECMCSCLSFKTGIFDEVWDLRGNGNPFFMGLRADGSDSAFIGPVQEAFRVGGEEYAWANIVGAAGLGLHRNSIKPGGFEWWYKADESLKIEAYWLEILNTSFAHANEETYGLRALYNIHDSPSMLQGFFAVLDNDGGRNRVYNIGGGADYWMDRLELFGEFIYQWGTLGARGTIIDPANLAGPGIDNAVHQDAYAFYVGGRYNFDVQMHPYVEIEYQRIDGDHGDHDDVSDGSHNFVSYSNNRSEMILEDNLFGLGVKTNYWKIQGEMGATTCVCREDDLRARFVIAYNRLVAPPDRIDLTDVQPGRGLSEDLGTEFDGHIEWAYSDSLRFSVNAAGLWSGDFWNDPNGFGRGTLNDNGDASSTMWMATVEAQLRF